MARSGIHPIDWVACGNRASPANDPSQKSETNRCATVLGCRMSAAPGRTQVAGETCENVFIGRRANILSASLVKCACAHTGRRSRGRSADVQPVLVRYEARTDTLGRSLSGRARWSISGVSGQARGQSLPSSQQQLPGLPGRPQAPRAPSMWSGRRNKASRPRRLRCHSRFVVPSS